MSFLFDHLPRGQQNKTNFAIIHWYTCHISSNKSCGIYFNSGPRVGTTIQGYGGT